MTDIPGLFSQLGSISPTALYHDLDEWYRTAAMFLAENMELGMGGAIIAISTAIRLVFMPFQLKMQVQAAKMRLLGPEMKASQDKIKKATQNGDYGSSKAERLKFNQLRKDNNIGGLSAMVGLLQIPFLITWFLSLRYMAMNPDLFPKMYSDGFLWFKNLAEHDPYFILPIISAVFSSLNIAVGCQLT